MKALKKKIGLGLAGVAMFAAVISTMAGDPSQWSVKGDPSQWGFAGDPSQWGVKGDPSQWGFAGSTADDTDAGAGKVIMQD